MEIEIPNHTSNGFYNVKKYVVICSGKFGSKSGELQLGKINGQEKEIKVTSRRMGTDERKLLFT